MAGNIGDCISMIEQGIAGLRALTEHEPSTSMDDEMGEGEAIVEKTVGRGRKKHKAPAFVKKEEDGGTDD